MATHIVRGNGAPVINPTDVAVHYIDESTGDLYESNGFDWIKKGPLNLADIKDVDLLTTPPEDGQVLVYDADTQTWLPGTPASGGGGGGGGWLGAFFSGGVTQSTDGTNMYPIPGNVVVNSANFGTATSDSLEVPAGVSILLLTIAGSAFSTADGAQRAHWLVNVNGTATFQTFTGPAAQQANVMARIGPIPVTPGDVLSFTVSMPDAVTLGETFQATFTAEIEVLA